MQKITADYFTRATGRAPVDDDLERSNCDCAGGMGHSSCGWDFKSNLPNFMSARQPLQRAVIEELAIHMSREDAEYAAPRLIKIFQEARRDA